MTIEEMAKELKKEDEKIATILLYSDEEEYKKEKAKVSIALRTAIKALEKQDMLLKWIEYTRNIDIEYHSAELAAILKDFLIKEVKQNDN